jgi:glutamate mutase epsilon subunit
MPIKTRFDALRFKSFHAMAASRGDGLHHELVQLFERLAEGADANLSETIETYKRMNAFDQSRVERRCARPRSAPNPKTK